MAFFYLLNYEIDIIDPVLECINKNCTVYFF